MIWLLGLAIVGTLIYSLVGLFLDRKSINFQFTTKPIYPYDERYADERLRNSRNKYSFTRS